MKLYSNKLTSADVRTAFTEARVLDGADIYIEDVRDFRPRSKFSHGVQFYALSLTGNRATGHRAIGSYSLDGVERAASWDAYGYVIARLFKRDPEARIGIYDDVRDFIRRVESDSYRKEPKDFLDLVR